MVFFHKGFPICDNSLLHGTPPVQGPPHGAYNAAPAWNHGAHSYAYQTAPAAYNQWGGPVAYEAQALNEFGHNDINGPGGDKYVPQRN